MVEEPVWFAEEAAEEVVPDEVTAEFVANETEDEQASGVVPFDVVNGVEVFLTETGPDPSEIPASGMDVEEADDTVFVDTIEETGPIKEVEPIEVEEPRIQPPSIDAFLHAAKVGDIAAVRTQIELGADVDAGKPGGQTPLHYAAWGNRIEVVECLLSHGANPNPRNKDHFTPLHFAADRGNREIVEMLISRGAEIGGNELSSGKTPLHYASLRGHTDIVRSLLLAGAQARGNHDRFGCTPLHWAAGENRVDVVQLLLEHGADPNAKDEKGRTPLHAAASSGRLEVAKLLVAAGALSTAKDNDGRTPLFVAVGKDHEDVSQVLLGDLLEMPQESASVSQPGGFSERKSQEPNREAELLVAAKNGESGRVLELIREGVDPNSTMEDGRSALLLASGGGHIETVKALLDAGAWVDPQERVLGMTPLLYAAWRGHTEVVMLLIRKGAEVNAKNAEGFTPLHYAAGEGHLRIVEVLVAEGAEIDAPEDALHQTPLHFAAIEGNVDIMRFLLSHGANANAPNAEGMTPLLVAAAEGQDLIVDLLLDGLFLEGNINNESAKAMGDSMPLVRPPR